MDVAATRPVACADHPDRPAHARCMSCRKVLCDECATTWDGINYCSACLQSRAAAARPRSAWLSVLGVLAAIAGLAWAHARVLTWMGVIVAPFL